LFPRIQIDVACQFPIHLSIYLQCRLPLLPIMPSFNAPRRSAMHNQRSAHLSKPVNLVVNAARQSHKRQSHVVGVVHFETALIEWVDTSSEWRDLQ